VSQALRTIPAMLVQLSSALRLAQACLLLGVLLACCSAAAGQSVCSAVATGNYQSCYNNRTMCHFGKTNTRAPKLRLALTNSLCCA